MLKGIKDYYGTLELADPKITVRQLNSLLSHTDTASCMGGPYARYCIVRDGSDSNGPSDTANKADARHQSTMDEFIAAGEVRLKEADAARLRKGDWKKISTVIRRGSRG
ncbi:hypothetical protein FOVG_10142 [Fusarium oxysporum f. sp. pisi HDV247]|uniref:Uncharacterized protein n=1 Tax=Fusarium oxysporum f. sp. pisi HDV247 TaxID=1080344 RepID=W9PPK0_FUSOX|nr:hypothetical protein FOVG_10142 [Fusarium oxysporum f. sp. pisi HDV247]